MSPGMGAKYWVDIIGSMDQRRYDHGQYIGICLWFVWSVPIDKKDVTVESCQLGYPL